MSVEDWGEFTSFEHTLPWALGTEITIIGSPMPIKVQIKSGPTDEETVVVELSTHDTDRLRELGNFLNAAADWAEAGLEYWDKK